MRKALRKAAKAQETLTRSSLKDHRVVRSLFAVESRVGYVFVPAGELRPGDGDLLRSELDGLRSILEARLTEQTPRCLGANRQRIVEFLPTAHHGVFCGSVRQRIVEVADGTRPTSFRHVPGMVVLQSKITHPDPLLMA
jgi:hypothetical protein